jgi:hypothetical protein
VVGGRGSSGNHPPPPIPAHIQLQGEPSTRQQHTRTPNNRQQHTTTVDNSTLIHKITNVLLFKKLPDNLRGQKSLGPLKMSLELAHKVIVPPKKNYIPQFLKQRDINSYYVTVEDIMHFTEQG